jgi:glycerol-1-phosphate dehydrogenase [NAD(P)+]
LSEQLPAPVVVAQDALERFGEYVSAQHWTGVLLVMDANTQEAAGERVAGALSAAGVSARELVFPQREGLLAGEDEAARVRAAAEDGMQLVAVGSGVITDIVRYAAHLADRQFVSVPTAASMDGYASSGAAMQIDGVKVTYPARGPVAIFADPRIAAAAPAELTRAGIGDLLAKATARVDWLASHLLYGEPFSAQVAERMLEPLTFAASNAERVMAGEADAIHALLAGLVQSGIAMAIVGSSRPASGCEHHASHFWDLLAARGMRPHASHGLQVGYATRFTMRLQRFAFGGGVSSLRPPVVAEDPLGPAAREWLGEPSAEIAAAVQEKQQWIAAERDSWPRDGAAWAAVCARLGDALALFGEIEQALDVAEIPATPGYLDVDERTLRATFRYASRLRARYTVIDFLEGQGALDEALEATLR